MANRPQAALVKLQIYLQGCDTEQRTTCEPPDPGLRVCLKEYDIGTYMVLKLHPFLADEAQNSARLRVSGSDSPALGPGKSQNGW